MSTAMFLIVRYSTITLPIAPERAKQLKQSLRTLIVTQVIPQAYDDDPVVVASESKFRDATSVSHYEATIDSPTETWEYDYDLQAHLIGFWVYDLRTGEILGRFNRKSELLQLTPNGWAAAPLAERLVGITLGMTRERVKEILGPPDATSEGWFGDWHGVRWSYFKRGCVLNFPTPDGTLRSIAPLP